MFKTFFCISKRRKGARFTGVRYIFIEVYRFYNVRSFDRKNRVQNLGKKEMNQVILTNEKSLYCKLKIFSVTTKR